MHELYKLKELLMKELEEHGKNGNLSKASLETIDKLTHAIKNLDKVIECCEGDTYSSARGRYSREGAYEPGHSYAYSRDKERMDDHTKEELRKIIDRM